MVFSTRPELKLFTSRQCSGCPCLGGWKDASLSDVTAWSHGAFQALEDRSHLQAPARAVAVPETWTARPAPAVDLLHVIYPSTVLQRPHGSTISPWQQRCWDDVGTHLARHCLKVHLWRSKLCKVVRQRHTRSRSPFIDGSRTRLGLKCHSVCVWLCFVWVADCLLIPPLQIWNKAVCFCATYWLWFFVCWLLTPHCLGLSDRFLFSNLQGHRRLTKSVLLQGHTGFGRWCWCFGC